MYEAMGNTKYQSYKNTNFGKYTISAHLVLAVYDLHQAIFIKISIGPNFSLK